MAWTKLPPLTEDVHSGCLLCSSKPVKASMNKLMGVGFGDCHVSKDGEIIWNEFENSSDDSYSDVRLQKFEDMAKADPDHDWRAVFDAPLWSGVWQRHGDDEWYLIEKGEGFA